MLCVLVEVSLRRDQNFGPADAGRILLLENCQCLQVDAQGGRQKSASGALAGSCTLPAGSTRKYICLLPITSLFELHLKLWSPKEHGLK